MLDMPLLRANDHNGPSSIARAPPVATNSYGSPTAEEALLQQHTATTAAALLEPICSSQD
jgi:hypothetical protein